MQIADAKRAPERLLTWAPLLTGLAASYGPIAYNYGIALYFLSYAHGFVKRGLVGELFLPFAHFSAGGLRTIQFAFTFALFAATYWVFRELLFGSTQDRVFAGVLLAGPAIFSHIAIMFEQPDVTLLLLLLVIAAAFMRLNPTTAAFVSTLLSCVALLAHEGYSLALYPFVVATLWIACRQSRLAWWIAVLQVALVTAAFLAILHFGTLRVAPEVILADAARRSDVPIQRQVFDVMHSTLAQQQQLVAHFYAGHDFRILLAVSLAFTLPYAWLLLQLLRRVLRALHATTLDLVILCALFLTPLALCAFGHDVGRWQSDCAIDATFFLLVLAVTDQRARAELRAWASDSTPLLWLAWFLLLGPIDATSLRSVAHMSVLWAGN
ncbi:hypothetical protein SAMN05421819_1862 [Bryocella elongata]|uniref:Glycosyltransferase RgtA/B/C/D-like domain-containing protein n=1 Tax=Bryocella elongata TaxID=863522 RepID=A0A1H5X4V0_9BACT|nr:hypothetical protein [Bryocella elongata]SEG06377.1 hypothetical protein SAMN05421819_1862 [Bryocella elongata]